MSNYPCNGCDRQMVGCHLLCREYHQWRNEFEVGKEARMEEATEMSRSMKLQIFWRKMLGR